MTAPRAPKDRKVFCSVLGDSAEKSEAQMERRYYQNHYEVLIKEYKKAQCEQSKRMRSSESVNLSDSSL